MRDIRPDLRERLNTIAADRARLDEDERSVRHLLQREEMRFGEPKQASLPLGDRNEKNKTVKRVPAEPSEKIKFVMTTLADRQLWPLELIVEAAAEKGVDFNGKHPRRVLHFVLLGMQQRGLVEKIGKNEWRLTSNGYSESDANGPVSETAASLHA